MPELELREKQWILKDWYILYTMLITVTYLFIFILDQRKHISFIIGVKSYDLNYSQVAMLNIVFSTLIFSIMYFFNRERSFLSVKMIHWVKLMSALTMTLSLALLFLGDTSKYYWIGICGIICAFFLCVTILSAYANWFIENLRSR